MAKQLTTKLSIKKKKAYGHTRMYPNCETSKLLASLSDKSCFQDSQLAILKKLGYEVEITNGEE